MEQKQKPKNVISLKSLFSNYMPDFNSTNSNFQVLLAIVLGVIIILFVFWKLFKGKSKKNDIALLGLSGSGKTQLFSQLCHGKNVLSVTSVKESSGHFKLDNLGVVLMHDLPGHDRIRYSVFDKFKQQLRALIFILDASTIQEDIRDVAEFLYTIFCDTAVQSTRPDILIACNKQDIPSAKGATLIKSSLEKEINLLRVTKSNQLQSVGEGGNNNYFLGNLGQDFEFSHLKPMKVTFVESVAANGEQIKDITKWLNTIF